MSKASPAVVSDKYPETTSIDVDVKTVKKYKLGDKVVITIEGEITELRVPARKGTKDDWDKPCIRVRVDSKKVKNEDEYMADEDEDED